MSSRQQSRLFNLVYQVANAIDPHCVITKSRLWRRYPNTNRSLLIETTNNDLKNRLEERLNEASDRQHIKGTNHSFTVSIYR